MASSRRGAVKVNPVTGKMERLSEAEASMAGKTRDGCLVVDDRYINAAKDLGLGGANGMYGHMKALARMGDGAGDVPVQFGGSMQRERCVRRAQRSREWPWRQAQRASRPASACASLRERDSAPRDPRLAPIRCVPPRVPARSLADRPLSHIHTTSCLAAGRATRARSARTTSAARR